MIIFLLGLLIISIALNILGFIGVRNAINNVDSYEAYFEEIKSRLEKILLTLKQIDVRGSFESDDEVGSIFSQMKATIESLDIFLIQSEDNEKD